MLEIRWHLECAPKYMTKHSAACDLKSRESLFIDPGCTAKVPVGVWIEGVNWDLVPMGQIPELQVRARSGLAFKHSIMLANGVGTVDADYQDEICVLLYNGGKERFTVEAGMRVAQMAMNLVHRLDSLDIGEARKGGFGSTKS
ncbi:MAG: dUTP diphosphatase [Pseudobacteriovorax sp.]|nr:dUTP diphosphatase [Pseudobacteriovorax sp.]